MIDCTSDTNASREIREIVGKVSINSADNEFLLLGMWMEVIKVDEIFLKFSGKPIAKKFGLKLSQFTSLILWI